MPDHDAIYAFFYLFPYGFRKCDVLFGPHVFAKDAEQFVGADVANILDGQHRIEGLKEGLSSGHPNSEQFQLNVSIFVDLDMDDQSMVFATVNKAQTKVNKSLVYDLFAYAKSRSPQRRSGGMRLKRMTTCGRLRLWSLVMGTVIQKSRN